MKMTLTVIGSSSAGNCYVLQNQTEALIIEAGLPFDRDVKRALGWNVGKIKGVICSHYHTDHAAYLKDYDKAGFSIFALPEVIERKKIELCPHPITPGGGVKIGGFKVLFFPLIHYNTDNSRCPICGFLITHQDAGRICFFTDCQSFSREVETENGIIFKPYDFPNIDHWIMEANYDDFILNRQNLDDRLKERIRRSHMSLRNTIKVAKHVDLSKTKEILLIHLSDGNADERKFVREMRKATNKRVFTAHAGLVLDYSLNPFNNNQL